MCRLLGHTFPFRAFRPGDQFQPDFKRHISVSKIYFIKKETEKILQYLCGEEGCIASPTLTRH